MEKRTKETLGSAAVIAWLFLVAGMILATGWILNSEWRVFGAGVLLALGYLGAILTAQWADRA